MATTISGYTYPAGYGTGGGSPTGYSAAYGGIPNLPNYTTDTTNQVGTNTQSQMIQNLPNYMGMVGQATGNIQANLAGQVSPDVAANLGTQAAEFGAGSGQSLSQAAATNFLSRYGLTSNALQTQGQQQLLSQMQATPIQQTSTQQNIQDLGAQRAVYASAPVPSAAAGAAMGAAQQGINAGRGSVGGGGGGGGLAAPTTGMGWGVSSPTYGGNFSDQYTQSVSDPFGQGWNDMGQQSVPDPWGQGWNDLGQQSYDTPANTSYDPNSDTSYNNYGLQDWFS